MLGPGIHIEFTDWAFAERERLGSEPLPSLECFFERCGTLVLAWSNHAPAGPRFCCIDRAMVTCFRFFEYLLAALVLAYRLQCVRLEANN